MDSQAALRSAQSAIALVPDGFDANLSLGDALAATGNQAEARVAYTVAMRRVAEMEPTAQAYWRPILEKKLAGVVSKEQHQ